MDRTPPSATGDPVGRIALALAARRPIDHDVPLDAAGLDVLARHGLVPAAALEGPPRLSRLATPAATRLQLRQEIMARHRRRLTDSLTAAGIESVLLKGAAVARHYRNPLIRRSTDVDLLVRPSDVERALEVFAADAAVTDIPRQGPSADKRHVMVRDESGVNFVLDLHWHLFSYHQLGGVADHVMSDVWSATTVDADGERRLPIGAEVAFLACHAVLDHRFRLILSRDLAEIADNDPDWDEVAAFSTEAGVASFVWAALLTASVFVNAGVPPDVLDRLRVPSVAATIYSHQISRIDPVRFDGRRPHLLNLGAVLMHDRAAQRLRLGARAPAAFVGWSRRTSVAQEGTRRAAVLVASNQRRGAEVFGERLAQELRGRGWDVALMAMSASDGPSVDALVVDGGGPRIRGIDLGRVRRLRSVISSYDVVLANGSTTLPYSVLATRFLLRRPALVYASIGEPRFWVRGRWRPLVQRILLKCADIVVGVSKATVDQLIDHVGLEPANVRLAPTGVETRSSPPDEASETLRIVMVGSLSDEKRPMLGLDVVAATGVPVVLRYVGGGALAEPILDRARTMGIEEHVEMVGQVDDVGPHLEWCHVILQTSASEGLPGVLMEAAAAGRAAVAFDVGGTSEVVEDGVSGFVCGDGDVEGMAAALRRLASEPGLVLTMGRAASAAMQERYPIDAAVDRYDAALREAIDRRTVRK